MKKLLIIGMLLLAALASSAQLRPSIRVGATASNISEQHIKMGIRAGVGIDCLFTERWGIRSGLFYSMKGATTSNNVFNYDKDKATKLSYLDLPVEALVMFRLSQNSRLAVHGGAYLACLLHSAVPAESAYDIRKGEIGASFGIDFTTKHFIFGPEVQYGLNKATKPGDSHNITYALTFGCRF